MCAAKIALFLVYSRKSYFETIIETFVVQSPEFVANSFSFKPAVHNEGFVDFGILLKFVFSIQQFFMRIRTRFHRCWGNVGLSRTRFKRTDLKFCEYSTD